MDYFSSRRTGRESALLHRSTGKTRYLPIVSVLLFLLPVTAVCQQPLAEDASRLAPDGIPRGDFRVNADLPLQGTILEALPELTPDERSSFLETGELIYRHGKDFIPRVLPDRRAAQRIRNQHLMENNNFAIEMLMALKLPENMARELSADELELEIFNLLHRISTLAGLDYFSASRGRMREFYLSSTIVKSEDDMTALPDPVFSSLQEASRFTMRQEDASFGDNLYSVEITPGVISIQNINPMTYNFIRIAAPGALELQLRIIPRGDHLLFYAFSSLRAPKIFGIQNKLSNSFYNRMTALYTWFSRQLYLTEF